MKTLASAAVAYYGLLTSFYLAREVKGRPLLRTLGSAVTAYYTVMIVITLNQRTCNCRTGDPFVALNGADSGIVLP